MLEDVPQLRQGWLCSRFERHKVGMTKAMVAVQQHLDSLVQRAQQAAYVYLVLLFLDDHAIKQLGPGRHLFKHKAATQCDIESGQGAVGGVHGADKVEVVRYAKGALGVRQSGGQRLTFPSPLAGFYQGDQLTEDARNVAPVDLVDDQHIGGLLE